VKIAQEEAEDIILPTNDDTPELVKIRHSTAHIMAMAVQRLFRERKLPCRTIDALSLLSACIRLNLLAYKVPCA
jgi:hypothetical protein